MADAVEDAARRAAEATAEAKVKRSKQHKARLSKRGGVRVLSELLDRSRTRGGAGLVGPHNRFFEKKKTWSFGCFILNEYKRVRYE